MISPLDSPRVRFRSPRTATMLGEASSLPIMRWTVPTAPSNFTWLFSCTLTSARASPTPAATTTTSALPIRSMSALSVGDARRIDPFDGLLSPHLERVLLLAVEAAIVQDELPRGGRYLVHHLER